MFQTSFPAPFVQYIGEVCHYLLAAKEVPEERQHRVRLMFGNGLRAAVWREFAARYSATICLEQTKIIKLLEKNRFRVKNLYEVYGSTEGNTTLLNIASKPGCYFLFFFFS